MEFGTWKTILWRQFSAAVDMLENGLAGCPEALWGEPMLSERSDRPDLSQFWYVAYHTLFWLDLYLDGAVEGFAPPAPFDLAELDPQGLLPERQYSRQELLGYLAHCRAKCREKIESLTETGAERLCKFGWGELLYVELLLDNMRHVQEHAAQLNLFLGQRIAAEPGWVARGRVSREGE